MTRKNKTRSRFVGSKQKGRSRSRKVSPPIDLNRWNTSDEEEILKREYRAKIEKCAVKNLEPARSYFSDYQVTSAQKDRHYRVEIRSLTARHNTCDCPDYQINQLGTCKHIETVLMRLKKNGVKRFKVAGLSGSERIEIFADPCDAMAIKVLWPTEQLRRVRKSLEPFFLPDNRLREDWQTQWNQLMGCLVAEDQLRRNVRVSYAVPLVIENHTHERDKARFKTAFLKKVMQGKVNFDYLKKPLYPYQQEGLLHLALNERALLADEMGLGKTVQAIAACEFLRRTRQITRVVVITTASLKAEWEEQIQLFTNHESILVFGSKVQRLRYYDREGFFYLLNYEQVVADHAVIQAVLSPDVVILDEAQRIKNWRTKTAQAVKQLKSRYAFVLTGTPIENRLDDLYSIVQFIEPSLLGALFRFNRDFYAFSQEEGKPDQPVGYKNLDALSKRLESLLLCRKKATVEKQLPQRSVTKYFVPMAAEQRLRYDEYERRVAGLLHRSKHRTLRAEEFERLQRYLSCLRMLCDTPYILDATCRVCPKLDRLKPILEEHLQDNKTKILIFSEWKRMLELIHGWLSEQGYLTVCHTGSMTQPQRRDSIRRFKKNPACRVFLSTDSGSTGLNLQVANVVINLDLPWNPARLEQRIARAWRKYQTRAVQVIHLICENSIEQRMLSLLKCKQGLADALLSDGEEDCPTEMALPSGRKAFIDRMESLMTDSLAASSPAEPDAPVLPLPSSTMEKSPTKKAIELLLDEAGNENLESVYSYSLSGEKNNGSDEKAKTLWLAVCDHVTDAKETQNYLEKNNHRIRVIDKKTQQVIEELIKAGVLSRQQSVTTLYHRDSPENQQQRQQEQLDKAKTLLSQAQRKQEMANLLIKGGFAEEAIAPLRQAHQSSLEAFMSLANASPPPQGQKLSSMWVEEVLISRHQLPPETLSLFNSLNRFTIDSTDSTTDQIKYLYGAQENLMAHVQQQCLKQQNTNQVEANGCR